ncbi:MAG: hypothetical protein NDF55_10710 [archaeon GB-1867-005]|nr:hypothetical protein [Candidatus Culexmicrobium cathedralense]
MAVKDKNYKLTLWIYKNKLLNEVLDYLLEHFQLLAKHKRDKFYLKELEKKFKAPRKLLIDILAELHNAGQIVLSYSPKKKDIVIFSIEYYRKKHGYKPRIQIRA